jgi:hypothetical protein
MASTARSPGTTRSLLASVADSAFIIAIAGAVFYFAGSTFRHAYYTRFGINPALLPNTNVGVALEGANAILFTAGAWFGAFFPLLVVISLVTLVGAYLDKRRVAASAIPIYIGVATIAVRLIGAVLILTIIAFAGTIAGASQAKDRFNNLRQGKVWTYHLEQDVVSGLAVGQTVEATWVLTKDGVRQLKTSAIRRVDGPLFNLVSAPTNTD